MNYYGVGLAFGGTNDMWDVFSKYDCWFMDYDKGNSQRLDNYIAQVQEGDILIGKAFGSHTAQYYYIRAVGIVVSSKLPSGLPEQYHDKTGFSVIWIKHFNKPVAFDAKKYQRGGIHSYTIYHETNEKLLHEVRKLMKY